MAKYVPNKNVIQDKRKKKEEEKKQGYRYDSTGKKITSSNKEGGVKTTSPSAGTGTQTKYGPYAQRVTETNKPKTPEELAQDFLYQKYKPTDQQVMHGIGNTTNKDIGTRAYDERTNKAATDFSYNQMASSSDPEVRALADYYFNLQKVFGGDMSVLGTQKKSIEDLKEQGESRNWIGKKKFNNQDEIDKAEAEYQDYLNAARQYGYETTSMNLADGGSEDVIPKRILERHQEYSREQLEKDLYELGEERLYGEKNVDAAARRLSDYFGEDLRRAVKFDYDGEWMQQYLDRYDANEAAFNDYLNAYSGTYGTEAEIDMNAYMRHMEAAKLSADKETRLKEYNEQRAALHEELASDPEYEAFSQYVQRGEYYTPRGIDTIESWDDASMLNDLVEASGDPAAYKAKVEELEGTKNSDLALSLKDYIKYMSDEDRSDFRYLLNKHGFDAAFKFITEDIMWNLGRQYEDEEATRIERDITNNPWMAIPYSVSSFGDMLFGEIAGAAAAVGSLSGMEINEYSPLLSWARSKDVKRGTTSGWIANETENAEVLGINIPSALYNGGMSAADSAINTAIFGHMATPMMAFGTYGTALYQNIESMGNVPDAYIDAAVEGGIEALTEYFSVEGLLDDTVTSGWKVLLRQAYIEPSEEVFGELLRTGYDMARYGENSKINRQINALIAMGYSESDAEAIAARDFARNLGETIFTAAVSGMAGGASNAVQQGVANQQTGKALDDDGRKSLLDVAKTLPMNKQMQKIMANLEAEIAAKNAQGTATEEQVQEQPEAKEDVNPAERLNQTAADQKQEAVEPPPMPVFNRHREQTDTGTGGKVAEQTVGQKEDNKNEEPPMPVFNRHQERTDTGTGGAQTTEAKQETAAEQATVSEKETVPEQENAEVEEQAEELAEEVNGNPAKNADAVADKLAEAKKSKNKRVTKAQVGMLYRATMQKLDQKAQDALRERMSFNVAKELKKQGVASSAAKSLAESILRIQDGTATAEDTEAIAGNAAARGVLLAYTAKVEAEAEAAGKVKSLAGLLTPKAPKTEAQPEKVVTDEFDAVEAEVDAKFANIQASEGETSTLDGEEVEIVGVAASEDGATPMVKVITHDGEERTVEADSIAYGAKDGSKYQLAQYASKYGSKADVMYNGYQDGQDVKAYARAFNTAYRYGSDGRNLNVLKESGAASALRDSVLDAAYKLGRDQRVQRNKAQQAARSVKGAGVKVGKVDASAIRDVKLNPHQRSSIAAMTRIAKALGINVRLIESKADAQGRYTTENGSWNADTRTLTLDIHAGSNYAADVSYSMMHTVGHELTHYIKQFADSALWDEYQEFVMSHLDTRMDLEKAIEEAMARDSSLDRDGAIEEIIADASVKALEKISEQDIAELAESNPTLFKKIKDFISKWVADLKKQIREAFGSGKGETNRFAHAMEDQLDVMAAKWNKMLVNASRNANKAKTQKKAPEAVQPKKAQKATEAKKKAEPKAAKKLFIPYAHIDERSLDSVKDIHTELFCSKVEGARVAYAAAAGILMDDLSLSSPGQKHFIWGEQGDLTVTGQKRITSNLLADMKDHLGWTWDEISNTLQSFIDMGNAEKNFPLVKNTIRNRRMEVLLHEMLTQGYTTIDGTKIAPWSEYIEMMAEYQGSQGDGLNARVPEGAIPFEEYAFPEMFDDVKYMKRDISDEGKSAKQQIASHAAELNAMQPVANVNVKLPTQKGKAALAKWVIGELEKTGYKVERKGFGIINFDEARIKKSLNYTNDRGEIAAFAALPKVLKRGIQVGGHTNHKGRNYGSVTFAAPVTINGTTGNMGVVVVFTSGNQYKTHRILMPDGSSFAYNEKTNAELTTERGVAASGSLANHISSASGDNITYIDGDVKFSMRDADDDAAYVKEAKAYFGKTYSYSKAGYIVTDGSMLDFSGKHEGYDSGSRSVDHREIWDVREPDEMSGTEAMIDFMAAGNIRLSPEMGGINLITAPTKAQESTLRDYISKFRGEVVVDIDNERGETIHSFEYNRGTHYSRVLNDLRAYFEDGTMPEAQSNLAQFRYQLRDPYNVSDRELLANAVEGMVTNVEDLNRLKLYKKKIGDLNEKQRLLQQTTDRIAMLRKTDAAANKDEIARLKNQAEIYAKQIERADAKLLEFEALAPVKALAKRQRAAYVKDVRAKADERIREYKKDMEAKTKEKIENIRKKEAEKRKGMREEIDRLKRVAEPDMKEKYRAKILADAKRLYTWITAPTNKKHVPEILKVPLGEFIQSIDYSSARSLAGKGQAIRDIDMAEALENLRRVLANAHNQKGADEGAQEQTGYIDLPDQYLEQFDYFVGEVKKVLKNTEKTTETPLLKMKLEQLEYLSEMFAVLKHSVEKMNEMFVNNQFETPRSASDATIDDMYAMKAKVKTNKALETINTMFNWKNTTPYYAFQRLGKGGKAIFEALQDGWDKMARNSALLIKYAENAFTPKQAKAWSKDIKTIKLDSGESVQMTAAQAMSVYCLNKRAQAQGHLLGGGIRISDISTGRGNTIHQVDNYILSGADVAAIIDTLTEEQKGVADKLQEFMNTQCTDWGNEISMKRFGYKMFTEKHYFPIETDANNRTRIDDKKDGGQSMFRLLNMSAMKPLTPKANNAIIIRDIFDVFSNHTSDIAKYNALALPILDFIKWYNHVEKSDVVDNEGNPTGQIKTRSTQKALEHAYGQNAKQYLTSFIKDLNAEHDGGRNDTFLSKLMGNAKAGAVSANPRVYFLQITSLPRAAYAISPKYLLKGMRLRNLNPVNAIKGTEAQEKIGILQWKKLGFYSTDVARSTRSMVRRDEGIISKIRDIAMKPAEWGDNWVSNIIYDAVRAEMKDKHPELEAGTKAYETRLNQRVREIVYKTQVVDSTMTRSDFMRSKGLMTAFTAFMSEPTLTVNMLNESIQEAVANRRAGMKGSENLKSVGGKVVRAAAVFAFTACFTALVESLFDALRDDDDYEEFGEKFADAIGGNVTDNVNIFAMLPIIKDVVSLVQGYENNSMVTQVAEQFIDVKDAITAWKEGKRPVYSVIYNMLKVAGSASGVGVQNATRDGVGLYNAFLADAWNTPKVQTYSDSRTTAAEAYYSALRKGDSDKAEWILERAEINGFSSEDITAKIKDFAKADYIAGNIDAETAKEYLISYGGKDADDAYWMLKEWDNSGEENFSKYGDLRDALSSGSRSDATAAYNELVEHGVKKETVNSEITKLYNNGTATNMLNLQLRSNNLYTSTLKLKADGQKHPDDFDAFITAILNGSGVESEISKLRKKGYTTKQLMSAINGAFGSDEARYRKMEQYNSREAAILLDRILDAYEALGLNREDEREWIEENWIMPEK